MCKTISSKPLLWLAHVDYLDQIQAHSGHTHVQTCYTQCILVILFHPSAPHDGISGSP
jgi:hypothetical protein